MGKRKHCDDDRIRKKIRRLENKLRRRQRSQPDSSNSPSSEGERSPASEPVSPTYVSDEIIVDEQSDYSDYEPSSVRSVVAAEIHYDGDPPSSPDRHVAALAATPALRVDNNECSAETALAEASAQVVIAPDILYALGESKTKEVLLGAKIPEEISKRWGRILIDGLSKEHKQELVAKTLIPENFLLLKAPVLNQEIAAVLTESSRNRDKRLEKAQNQLGLGIAGITSLMSSLIEGKVIDTVDIIKKLSETGQILLDLHYENTINRTKLITPILDKKFLSMIQDVKRDSHLFGENLGGTIKATKTAEKSGLQIKKPTFASAAPSKKFQAQAGSWRGPPKHQGQRAARPTASRSRGAGAAPAPAASRRAPPPPYPADRHRTATRPARTTRK